MSGLIDLGTLWMEEDVWIERREKAELTEPWAVLGSSGMRSIGRLVLDHLIVETKAKLVAELYSTHLPVIYETKPSFAAHPSLPGFGGVTVQSGQVELPKVQFYAESLPPVIFALGYHANFDGQYNVAEKTVDFLSELHVKRIIVIAGYSSKEKKVCCAAANKEIMLEMKEKFSIEADYKGPFYGFSGLVFGLAKLKGIEAVCLFGGTEPNMEDPEAPDEESSNMVLGMVKQLLDFYVKVR
jgi:proteasome assembly chaperone (PAC2) family protein